MRKSFTGGLIAGAVVAGLLAFWFLRLSPAGGGDDERPPIIVNNGSVDFKALPVNGDSGTWDADNKGNWRQKHPNGGPSTFDVSFVLGFDTCADENGRPVPTTFEKVTSLKLNYDDNGTLGNQASVSVVNDHGEKYLNVNAPSGTASKDLLTIGSAKTEIKSGDLVYKGNQKATCTPTGSVPLILIQQRK